MQKKKSKTQLLTLKTHSWWLLNKLEIEGLVGVGRKLDWAKSGQGRTIGKSTKEPIVKGHLGPLGKKPLGFAVGTSYIATTVLPDKDR